MIELTTKTKLGTMMKYKPVKHIGKYFIYSNMPMMKALKFGTFEKLEPMGWNTESIFDGYRHLCDIAEKKEIFYPVYEKEACRDDKNKKDVNIIHFLADTDSNSGKKPYIILCAGGAYVSVCSLVEAYPVAAAFNKLGYHCFALTYRVGGSKLMPKPLEDLAAGVGFIRRNSEKFGVEPDNYIVCGFSAGGNLCALWGTEKYGYKAYDLPKPKALFPIYPAINSSLYRDDDLHKGFLTTMFGKEYERIKEEYDVDTWVNKNYPPAYIVNCEDDDMIDYRHSVYLKEALEKNNIPVKHELGKKGGHGFGDGRATDVAGWMERAAAFEQKL